MIETIVLGWFLAAAIHMMCETQDPAIAPMTALQAPPCGEPVGCHWEHPRDHELAYFRGPWQDRATHLCNSRCVHEPPEER